MKRYSKELFGFTIGLVCMVGAPNVSYNLLCMSFALLGFFVLPLLPTVIELTAEVTYPYCSEDVAVGTLFPAGNLAGAFILSLLHISSSMRTAMFPPKEKERKTLAAEPSNIFMLASALVMVVVVLLRLNLLMPD